MNRADEHRFIDRILEGEKNVFRYFIQEYQQMALAIAISMIKNETDAQDAVQNAFISAFKGLRSFKKESKFSSWLYKIVVNESLKQIKRSKSKSEYIDFNSYTSVGEAVFNDAVVNIELSEKREAIQRVIKQLKPKEALVLTLHYLHEKSLKEIVEITGFKSSNVKVLLFRARKSFMGKYLEQNQIYEG